MKTPNQPETAPQMKQVHRVVTFLDRSQVDYLDKMGKDALFSTGVKFPRTRIISALIDLLRKLNVSGESLRSDLDLEQRLLQKMASGSSEAKRVASELMEGNRESSARIR